MTLALDQPATCTHLCFSHNNNSRLHKRVILAYICPCTATCVVRSVEVDVRPILRKSTTRSGVGPTMLNRSKSSKDIRSRIKHENVRLGAGTQMGGVPNNFGLQTNAFQVQSQRTHQHSPSLGHRRDVFDAPDLYGGTSEVPSHNAHPLGAGPSFVSLSPSDSISNFEGRPGHAPRASSNQLFEPSAGSTASFAQNLNDASDTPSRPARSMRRPQRESAASIQQTSIPVGRNLLHSTRADKSRYDAADTEDYDHRAIEQTPSSSHDRHARSARLMAQVHQGMDGRATPASMISDEDEAHAAINDDKHRSHSPLSSPPLGSLTRNERPTALNSVLNALTEAGRKQGQTRILRGVTAEEESRRRKIERKYEAAKSRESQPLEAYVDRQDERAFQEICAVLRKVKTEWDFVVDDDFNSVSLALSLLDDSSLGSSRQDFEQIKALIEHALQGTVDDHYESFATAISLHDNVLNSLGTAQSGVSGARRRLRDAREALGAKRADLVQLWHRSQAVKESIHLLDIIDNLKSVPDRLESLMAEKQFLEAVNLLMRAVKMCEKGEVLEVGATADLRVYLKGQEQAMFDILVEELHNHLYLKSYFCDSRWKSYTTGQTTLPDVDFGQDYEELKQNSSQRLNNNASRDDEDVDESLAKNSREHPIKLTKYLKALNLRPAPDAANDLMPDLISTSQNAVHESSELPSSKSTESFAAINSVQNQQYNPETDSFLYIEMLLESLARLGKLKMTQEVILQRLPVELHQLVDSTIEEVDTRSEMMRRSSSAVLRPESLLLSNSSALARSFSENARTSFRSSLTAPGNLSLGAVRMSALETGQVERDSETMRDLFWTLFSKLDAVLQGHRVIFEVVTKISSRKASSAYKAVKVGKPSSLTEIWRPIQTEVRNLLHEYLVDEAETSSARRNAIISVNEVLRQGSFHRDRSKPLFRLVADSAPKPGVNLSRRDFAPLRKHEEALSNALRASVPGLVGTSDGSNSSAVYQKAATSLSPSGREGAGGHKLLVKPDAFNISVLFQPALAFIERVKVLLPPEAAGRSEGDDADGTGTGFSRFLDEFVRDVFLSQLEDKVQTLFSMAVSGSDAFQEDAMYRARSAEKPIVRSVTNVVVLIDSLYSMLRTTPFHRESYSLLIIQIIVQYYQRCHDRFRDLVSSDVTIHAADNTPVSVQPAILSAIWAERPEISNCLLEILDPDSTLERQKELRSLENALELRLAGTVRDSSAGSQQPRSCTTIALKDLMTNRKKLLALGNLYNSLVRSLSRQMCALTLPSVVVP